jgi:hypothetical protein
MRRSVVIATVAIVLVGAVVAILALRTSSPYPQLSAKLLNSNQVPRTWQSESFQKAQDGMGCFSSAMSPKAFPHTAEVDALYVNDGTVPPSVGEEIATFHDSQGAFVKIISSLEQCKSFHGKNGILGSLGSLALPQTGNSSQAFLASISDETVPVTLTDDLEIIRQGKYVIEIYEANLGNVNHPQFEKFISKALSNL